MEDIQPKLTVRDFSGYVLAYLLWLLAVSATMWAVFEARNALNVMWPELGSGIRWRWTLRPADRVADLGHSHHGDRKPCLVQPVADSHRRRARPAAKGDCQERRSVVGVAIFRRTSRKSQDRTKFLVS